MRKAFAAQHLSRLSGCSLARSYHPMLGMSASFDHGKHHLHAASWPVKKNMSGLEQRAKMCVMLQNTNTLNMRVHRTYDRNLFLQALGLNNAYCGAGGGL